jgi:hypothetical protein
MKQQFVTPVGRLVQGDPMEAQTKDMQGNPLTVKSGPSMGQPTQAYICSLAIRKDDPKFPEFWAIVQQTAQAAFPQHFSNGQCTHPQFSFKLMDGDGVDGFGKPNSNKEGFAGHWVVKFKSSFAPKCYYLGRHSEQDRITDKNIIRKGYFIRIAGTVEGNNNAQKPGVYMNLNFVELVAHGTEIVSGPDVGQVFGAVPVPALPAGATALPAVPAAQPAPFAAPQAAVPVAMPGAITPQPATAPVAVTPNPGIMAVPGLGAMPPAAAPPMAPQAPAAAPTYRMTIGFTKEQMYAQGWTDETMIAAGHMVQA